MKSFTALAAFLLAGVSFVAANPVAVPEPIPVPNPTIPEGPRIGSRTTGALEPRNTYPVVEAISNDPTVNGTFLTGLDGDSAVYVGPRTARQWVSTFGPAPQLAFPPLGVENLYLVEADATTSYKPVKYSVNTGIAFPVTGTPVYAVPGSFEGYFKLYVKGGSDVPPTPYYEATLIYTSG